jgi:signal transduction histidine kinase
MERTMVTARWIAVVFALLQVQLYDATAYPTGVRATAYSLVGVLAALNLAAMWAVRHVRSRLAALTLVVATMVGDVLIVTAFVWTYSFDGPSVHFLLFFALPAEAALKFALPGALLSWAAITVLYTARQAWAAATYGLGFSLPSISYRTGILLLVAFIVGAFADRARRSTQHALEALHALRREEEWRSALIDMLAHDIRSPVATTISMLQLLGRESPELDPERRADLRQRAIRQSRRALELSDDILTMARARQQQLELHPEDLELLSFSRQVVSDTFGDGSWLTIDIPVGFQARADPQRLEQILCNLLSNARKHGQPPVMLRATKEADATVIQVSDSGAGVPDEQRADLFEPFASGARKDSVGLGLWLVRTLAVAHGGDAWYETIDGQPTFTIRIADEPRRP